jgi:uncharacterized protein YgbK (DUF1537 family)
MDATTPRKAGASGLRLAFLGDDFTGSTDALEALALEGWRCALFLDPPDAATLAGLGPLDAIGVAGEMRSMTPEELHARLPPIVAALAAMPVPLVHYKVCSTFDSSPAIGSIGVALDIARPFFGDCVVPIVAGAPALGRYCAFGNLHARAATDGRVHRLDRHPIMSRHPVTPMAEADLVLHLGAQTTTRIANLALPQVAQGAAAALRALEDMAAEGCGAVLLDTATTTDLLAIAAMLEAWPRAPGRPLLAIGSSGLEHALALRDAQAERPRAAPPPDAGPVRQVLVVSGSASALGAAQLDAAFAAGFADVPVDAARLAGDGDWRGAADALVATGLAALRDGRSVVLHSTKGTGDPRIAAALAPLLARGMSRAAAMHEVGARLGHRLGIVAEAILRAHRVPRLVLCGGDTASHVARHLAPTAFVVSARLARGAPLCRVLSRAPHLDGLEMAMKGGQMGEADYLLRALHGAPRRDTGMEAT